MKKKFTVAIIGCGNRGVGFAGRLHSRKDEFEVVALCDVNEQQVKKVHQDHGLENTQDFYNEDVFFAQKRADFLVIATHDRYHVAQCVRALELGYDVLLEKPISDNRAELELLLKTQEKTGGKVLVCHELRYAPGFVKCAELLRQGIIGELYAIDASERVAYWHWVQAYVRGEAHIGDPTIGAPVILAKCSHDLDLLQMYAGSMCETVSSIGGRRFFNPANCPKDAAERCMDCLYVDTCPYSAKRIYIDAWYKAGEPRFSWPYSKVCIDIPFTEEKLRQGLATSAYGKCVFTCSKGYFVDHQLVQMRFKNGIHASLKMVYGDSAGRRIVFYGTYGEIIFDERLNEIIVMPFGRDKEIISIASLCEAGYAHGGGDALFTEELYGILTGKSIAKTSLKASIESHLMGIAAEESRKKGGALVKVH